jgi:hypothetical protein
LLRTHGFDFHTVHGFDRRAEQYAVAGIEARANLDIGPILPAEIEVAQAGDAIVVDRGAQTLIIEHHSRDGITIIGCWRRIDSRTVQ